MKKKIKKKPKFKIKAWAIEDSSGPHHKTFGPVMLFSSFAEAKNELYWYQGAKIIKCWVIPRS